VPPDPDGDPQRAALVPPTAKRRMYALVKGARRFPIAAPPWPGPVMPATHGRRRLPRGRRGRCCSPAADAAQRRLAARYATCALCPIGSGPRLHHRGMSPGTTSTRAQTGGDQVAQGDRPVSEGKTRGPQSKCRKKSKKDSEAEPKADVKPEINRKRSWTPNPNESRTPATTARCLGRRRPPRAAAAAKRQVPGRRQGRASILLQAPHRPGALAKGVAGRSCLHRPTGCWPCPASADELQLASGVRLALWGIRGVSAAFTWRRSGAE